MSRNFSIFALSAAALLFMCPYLAKAEVFSIAKPQFSARVLDDGNYTAVSPARDNQISRSSLDQGVVYFSFTVLGTDNAVDYLRRKGRLDVYAVIFADGTERDKIPIGIDQGKWSQLGKNLLDKYNSDGFFTWRTFMNTQQTSFSNIEVIIRDGLNNTVGRAAIDIVP